MIGHLWEEFSKRLEEKIKKVKESRGELDREVVDRLKTEVLNELGVRRYCCRRMFLSHVDIYLEIIKFPRVT